MSMSNIARNSGIVLLLSFSATLIGYFLRLFLARSLTVADYGLFYAVLAFIGFFAFVRDLGLCTALAKFIPEFFVKADLGKIKASILFVAAVQISLGMLVMIPVMVFSDTIALYLGTPAAALPMRIIALSFLVSIIMTLLQTVMQGLGRMSYFGLVEPLRLSVVFAVTASLVSLGVVGAAYGYLIASVTVAVVLFLLLVKSFPFFATKTEMNSTLNKKLMMFGLPVFVAGIGSMLINYMDTLILAFFRSLYEVGLYQSALPTSQLLWFFIGGISSVLLPAISGLWAEGRKDTISDGMAILAKLLFMLVMPFAIIFVAFPEIILRIMFGESYISAAASLQVLSIGALFYTFYIMYATILLGVGKPRSYTKLWFVVGGSSIVLNLILVPALGILGAAISTAVSYMIGLSVGIYLARKSIESKLFSRDIAKAFAGGIFVLLLIFVMKSVLNLEPIAEIASLGVASLVLYSAFAARFIVNKSDLKTLSVIGIKLPKFAEKWILKIAR